MSSTLRTALAALCAAVCIGLLTLPLRAADYPAPKEGDFTLKNFRFHDGESLPELRMHYLTLGTPKKDAQGKVTNAVLILHGTGGTGRQFLSPVFADVLFGPGQLLDATKYFIILPDNIGHGKSSKPSDGLHMRFPKYDYDDMVKAQHDLLTEGLGVNHLRVVMGTSMGCMHSWQWLETYPDFMDASMPLACEPVEIAGRNRIWRKAILDAITTDPEWKNGEYTAEPMVALRNVEYWLMIAGSAPVYWQREYPTREAAEKFATSYVDTRSKAIDANDTLYQFDSSRDYNPEPNLEKIKAYVMFVNSADDFINPPELQIPDREIKRVTHGKYVLLPISPDTRGHGTHTIAKVWKQYLAELLQESEPKATTR